MEGDAAGTAVDAKPSPPSPTPRAAAAAPPRADDTAPPLAAEDTLEGASRPPAATPSKRTLGRPDTLRDRIVEHLKATGTDSISGIARILSQDKDAPAHRLTVAGYLQAMSESGILRELDRPPSKLYQLQNPDAHWSLHQRLHRALQDAPRPEADKVRLAVAVLQQVLGRPVFQAELIHAGFHSVPEDIPRVVVGDAVRRSYRDLFGKRSSPRITVPARDPLLQLADDDPILASPAALDLMRRILARATGVDHLVAERPPGPQQAQLSLGGGL